MMKKEIEINELIMSYLAGTLPEADMQRVRDRMQEDASFAEQVEAIGQLHGVISDSVYVGLRDTLKMVHLRKMKASRNIRRITGFGSAGLIVGLAVLVLVTRHSRPYDRPLDPAAPLMEMDAAGPVAGETAPAIEADSGENGPEAENASGESGPGFKPAAVEPDPATELSAAALPATKFPDEVPVPVAPTYPESGVSGAAGTGTFVASHGSDSLEPSEKEDPVSVEGPETLPSPSTVTTLPQETAVINADEPTGLQAATPPLPSGDAHEDTGDTEQSRLPLQERVQGETEPDATPEVRDAATDAGRWNIDGYAYIFAPGRGDEWTVPVKEDVTGMLFIYSKEGIVVYTAPVRGSEPNVWRGQTVSGQGLDMGLYHFEIRYDDGTHFLGNVTLVR